MDDPSLVMLLVLLAVTVGVVLGLMQRRKPDPRYCLQCGAALERRESKSWNERTGERIPRPYAACPVIGYARYLGPDRGGWETTGNWPTHTAIFREPRWPKEGSK